jgi:hypothetical protein
MMDESPLTCSAEQLYTVVSSPRVPWLRLSLANPAMTPQHVVVLLRNTGITRDIVEEICRNEEWLSHQNVQFGIVNCPKTPHTLALRVLQLLYWNDLLKTAANMRLPPRLRRTAESHLRDKVNELTPGEKMTLARTGPRVVISFLRSETEPRIIAALLRNPHMIEGDVVQIANDEFAAPEVLAAIGKDYKWSGSYAVRLALVRNERTPLPAALAFVSRLRKQDLTALAAAPGTRELIRRAAMRILSGKY